MSLSLAIVLLIILPAVAYIAGAEVERGASYSEGWSDGYAAAEDVLLGGPYDRETAA